MCSIFLRMFIYLWLGYRWSYICLFQDVLSSLIWVSVTLYYWISSLFQDVCSSLAFISVVDITDVLQYFRMFGHLWQGSKWSCFSYVLLYFRMFVHLWPGLCGLVLPTFYYISGCSLISGQGLCGLTQLRYLEELELTNCPSATKEVCLYLKENMPRCMVLD